MTHAHAAPGKNTNIAAANKQLMQWVSHVQ